MQAHSPRAEEEKERGFRCNCQLEKLEASRAPLCCDFLLRAGAYDRVAAELFGKSARTNFPLWVGDRDEEQGNSDEEERGGDKADGEEGREGDKAKEKRGEGGEEREEGGKEGAGEKGGKGA